MQCCCESVCYCNGKDDIAFTNDVAEEVLLDGDIIGEGDAHRPSFLPSFAVHVSGNLLIFFLFFLF